MGILIKPIVSEKMTAETEKNNRYGFIQTYNVTVKDVNTINYHGKRKSRYSKTGMLRGRANHFKKAYVTLAGDDKIDFYANI